MRFAGKETLPRAILLKVGRGQAKVGVVYTMARGGHTPLCFVTTCDNGVFNGGVFMHFSIFFPTLFVDIKLL